MAIIFLNKYGHLLQPLYLLFVIGHVLQFIRPSDAHLLIKISADPNECNQTQVPWSNIQWAVVDLLNRHGVNGTSQHCGCQQSPVPTCRGRNSHALNEEQLLFYPSNSVNGDHLATLNSLLRNSSEFGKPANASGDYRIGVICATVFVATVADEQRCSQKVSNTASPIQNTSPTITIPKSNTASPIQNTSPTITIPKSNTASLIQNSSPMITIPKSSSILPSSMMPADDSSQRTSDPDRCSMKDMALIAAGTAGATAGFGLLIALAVMVYRKLSRSAQISDSKSALKKRPKTTTVTELGMI